MNTVKKRPPPEEEEGEQSKQFFSKKPRNCSDDPLQSDEVRVEQTPSLDLETLVDLTGLIGVPQAALEAHFKSLAQAILCNHHLVVGVSTPSDGAKSELLYEVLELEFYLWMEGSHADPFTHGSEEQRICGQWYFHRAPKFSTDSHRSLTSQTSYRSGSRKGLDLTIGRPAPSLNCVPSSPSCSFPTSHVNASAPSTTASAAPGPSVADVRGGILLRSLRRVSEGKIISGPSLLVDEILQASHSSGIPDLVSSKWSGDISAFRSDGETYLCLRRRPVADCGDPPIVHSSPRIGLELSHPGTTISKDHPRLIYLCKPYRFFVRPELLEKGRPQSFVGIVRACLQNGYTLRAPLKGGGHSSFLNGKLRKEVIKIMGVKESTVEKYFAEYLAGLDKGVIKLYIGAAGKGASTSPATYLRMVGALERYLDNVL